MVFGQALWLWHGLADQLAGLARNGDLFRRRDRQRLPVRQAAGDPAVDHLPGDGHFPGDRRQDDQGRHALALGRPGMILLVAALVAAQPLERAVTAPGPGGPLAGILVDAGNGSPVVLIIPGSGPTDRDGNNPLGVKAGPYRLLANALAREGVSTVRIDKRGMFGSKRAVVDANRVRIADYARDTHSWISSIRRVTGAQCVWLLGHSEGGLVALTAAQRPAGICGVITVAAVGRKIGTVLRQQLAANPANAPYLGAANDAIEALEAGKRVDAASLPQPLRRLFAEDVQTLLIDLFAENPAALAAKLKVPLLIVQGDNDIQ